jgi:hypothetical protein
MTEKIDYSGVVVAPRLPVIRNIPITISAIIGRGADCHCHVSEISLPTATARFTDCQGPWHLGSQLTATHCQVPLGFPGTSNELLLADS